MPWSTSARRADLPTNWRSLRARILWRDPSCRLRLEGCTRVSTEVDHAGERTDHRPHMLRGVCHSCHVKRTREQAMAARPPTNRPPESHPGLT